MDQGDDDYCHPVDDALSVYRNLSEIERRNIVRAANLFAGNGSYVSAHELISEAYVRISDGRRPWPKSDAFLPFFMGVMKSLLSDRMFLTDAGKAARLKHKLTVVKIDDLPLVAANDDAEDLADKVLLEAIISKLETQIAGDDEMELLWTGIQCRLIGKDLQEAMGVDAKRLAALRTRLNRHIDKLAIEYRAKEGRS
ncbi:MAG: transposase [Mesorhizobium sp.]|nr:MAG: transposase [Mesorhizobium sp.]